ncbi:hypothetical protein [Novipirellula maiorica]|uniref:hypothetical protein n=1 Tax=Novipirellula maiorica TaxID=1265734 RepID=UPI000348FFFD|nr:hypothetical protein [Rhodopirellula maiorica]
MRNLTLGVLIVSGGTLAALPFRRAPEIVAPETIDQMPGSSVNAQTSAGTVENHFSQGAAPSYGSPVPPSLRTDLTEDLVLETTTIEAMDTESFDSFSWNKPHASESWPSRRHQSYKPLTYEDLAVPISRPDVIQDRFNATASAQQHTEQQSRDADKVVVKMQPMEAGVSNEPWPRQTSGEDGYGTVAGTLAAADAEDRFKGSQRFAQIDAMRNSATSGGQPSPQTSTTATVAAPRQNATLASSPRRELEPTLPPPTQRPAEQTRQWITQPN